MTLTRCVFVFFNLYILYVLNEEIESIFAMDHIHRVVCSRNWYLVTESCSV